jgi:hypothetical protein
MHVTWVRQYPSPRFIILQSRGLSSLTLRVTVTDSHRRCHHDGACCTIGNETGGIPLVLSLLPKVIHFNGDEVEQFVKRRR